MATAKKNTKKTDTNKNTKKEEKEECVWLLGTEHGGDVERRLMFDGQLNPPVCEKHFEEHKMIMLLVANNYEIEQVVEMDPDEIKRLAYTLIMSGVELESGKY